MRPFSCPPAQRQKPLMVSLNRPPHCAYGSVMKALKLFFFGLAFILVPAAACAGNEVDRLLAEYAKIETVTCQIRRTKEGPAGKIRFLSRVFYTNKNQLHAEGITPVKRRTIADGQRLWQYAEGDPKGFSRPIDELSEQMAISLKMVPGTAMDHLLRLKGMEETVLPTDGAAAKRVGVAADTQYVVLQFDASERLSEIAFFKTKEMKEQKASYAYSDFVEVVSGAWIPMTHEATIHNDQLDFKETVKIDRFIANQPVAESLFFAPGFFDKDIDFVEDFAKIFP